MMYMLVLADHHDRRSVDTHFADHPYWHQNTIITIIILLPLFHIIVSVFYK